MTATAQQTAQGGFGASRTARQAAARLVVACNKSNGEPTDPRIIAIAEGREPDRLADVAAAAHQTVQGGVGPSRTARQAAARLVVACNKSNGEPTDPRIVAIAEGREPDQPASARSSEM